MSDKELEPARTLVDDEETGDEIIDNFLKPETELLRRPHIVARARWFIGEPGAVRTDGGWISEHDVSRSVIAMAEELEELHAHHEAFAQGMQELAEAARNAPIDMLLFCPECGAQHIDTPQPDKNWTNPPHRSHECQVCQTIWRPCDRPTNGVAEIATSGVRDMAIRTPRIVEGETGTQIKVPGVSLIIAGDDVSAWNRGETIWCLAQSHMGAKRC